MEDWCFPGCPTQSPAKRSAGKLVIVSGLDLQNTADSLATSLLSEYITGMAGNIAAQSSEASIVRVLIAGNSVSATSDLRSDKDLLVNAAENTETLAQVTDAIEKLDLWLENILGNCCVTLMPGQYDPTNYMLPQKPLHRFVLKKSSRCVLSKNLWKRKIRECEIYLWRFLVVDMEILRGPAIPGSEKSTAFWSADPAVSPSKTLFVFPV